MGLKILCPSVALVVAATVDSWKAVCSGPSGPERLGAMSVKDAFGASRWRRSSGSARGEQNKWEAEAGRTEGASIVIFMIIGLICKCC